MKQIIIKIEEGCVHVLSLPKDVEVVVMDCDTMEWDEENDRSEVSVETYEGEILPDEEDRKFIDTYLE